MDAALQAERFLLFAYASLMKGERDHALLHAAEFLGEARTKAEFLLVDLGVYGALVLGGDTSVLGEVYAVNRQIRFQLDVKREVPVLFRRTTIELADGRSAQTYIMLEEQVRGRRRLRHGDWRGRFSKARPGLR